LAEGWTRADAPWNGKDQGTTGCAGQGATLIGVFEVVLILLRKPPLAQVSRRRVLVPNPRVCTKTRLPVWRPRLQPGGSVGIDATLCFASPFPNRPAFDSLFPAKRPIRV
jgi:hypothetical protein